MSSDQFIIATRFEDDHFPPASAMKAADSAAENQVSKLLSRFTSGLSA